MVKYHESVTYLFAVGMRNGVTQATFKISGVTGEKTVEVIGEDRTFLAKDGSFTDQSDPWDVHLYRLSAGSKR